MSADPTFFLQMTWKGSYEGLDPYSSQIAILDPDDKDPLFHARVNVSLPSSTPQTLVMTLNDGHFTQINYPFETTTRLVIKVAEQTFSMAIQPKPDHRYQLKLERDEDVWSASCAEMQLIDDLREMQASA